MKAINKYVFQPIGNLFTRPKSVFGKTPNFISDILVPAALSFTPGVGPLLAAGYGGYRGYSTTERQNQAYGTNNNPWLGAGIGAATAGLTGWGTQALAANSTANALASGASKAAGMVSIGGGGMPSGASVYSGLTPEFNNAYNLGSNASALNWSMPSAGVAQNLASGITPPTSTGIMGGGDQGTNTGKSSTGFDIGKGLKVLGITPAGALAAGASLLNPASDTEYHTASEKLTQARQTVLSKYLGEAGAQLPTVIADQYLDMITKPIGELYPVETDARWGRAEQSINQSYDDYEKSITHNFAQAGGIGSSDYQKAMGEARRMRTQELSQTRQEIEQSLFNTQISMKQTAMQNAASQGQFDEKLAMELAGLIGQEDELVASIQSQDYERFQMVMGQIMAIGYQSAEVNRG